MGAENDIRGDSRNDLHSYANPGEIRVTHVALDLDVSFEDRTLAGAALLSIERVAADANRLVVDTRDLEIRRVEARNSRGDFSQTAFELGSRDPILGVPLSISVPAGAGAVRVHYATSPAASGLQWLDPPQTAGKQHPFLFTQSQAIHAPKLDSFARQPRRTCYLHGDDSDAARVARGDERRAGRGPKRDAAGRASLCDGAGDPALFNRTGSR